MNHKLAVVLIVVSLSLLAVSGSVIAQSPQPDPSAALGAAFTYQGRLSQGGVGANGAFDFEFYLFDALNGGSHLAGPIAFNDLVLSDGYFTVQLNFGSSPFGGQARYLEVRVKPGSDPGGFTILSPRQELTAAPYALYSLAAPWSGIAGIPAGFADGIDNDTTTFWSLSGNSGTNPASQYLGTSDNVAFELRANGQRILRLEPNSDGPNLIGGFMSNWISSGVEGATVFGGGRPAGIGYPNSVTDSFGTVSGGFYNQAGNNSGTVDDAKDATVGGGDFNTASGAGSTVCGGRINIASGSNSTIPGGYYNEASGDYSFAAGRRAKALYSGAFVWADSNDFDFSSASDNSFRARATKGFRLVAGIDAAGAITWSCAFTDGNSWSCTSDRNMKENFEPVDSRAILEKVSQLPVQTWNGIGADPNVRHMGPMAQDFFAAFGLGDDDKSISTIDLDGVALAAIQGLYQRSQDQAVQIEALQLQNANLEEENTVLKSQLSDIESRLAALERGGPVAVAQPLTAQLFQSPWLLLGGLAVVGVVILRRKAGVS
jgi:hypothetical protein